MEAKTQHATLEPARIARVPDGVVVEDLQGIAAMEDVEALQGSIWGSDLTWVVPSHLLYIVSDYGGILLGASIDRRLVGFVFGLLGRRDGHLLHASHMLGILPEYQGHGIGAALKNRQRERAREQGLDTMVWTFDPLEARNAYFNFHKLRVSCRTYRPDYYGAMRDTLNQGLPSDRLVVDWDLRDAGRAFASDTTRAPLAILLDTGGRPALEIPETDPGRPLAIHVPANIQALRKADPAAALAWRTATRHAFSWAFERGYTARDFSGCAHVLFPPHS
ncbi:MAG TPA: GNAT family N-acetyltransferase [Chloroflexota bacterium]|nr:GNAT family N-acetyltransferase [Chloroflexota bacterium]